jgi:hypothetical protein
MSLGYYLSADVVITEEELLQAIEDSGHLVNREAIEKFDRRIEISEFVETIPLSTKQVVCYKISYSCKPQDSSAQR